MRLCFNKLEKKGMGRWEGPSYIAHIHYSLATYIVKSWSFLSSVYKKLIEINNSTDVLLKISVVAKKTDLLEVLH